jgi:CRP-like cAMP-binding protein
MGEETLSVYGLPERSVGAGEILLEEGGVGSTVYILKKGAIKVVADNDKVLYETDTAGTVLGEIAALLGCAHSATVRAETECIVQVIDDLDEFFNANPSACLSVARTLAARVVNMNEHFVELRAEIDALHHSEDDEKKTGKLYELMVKMDEFWGRDVRDPLGKNA